MTQPTHDAVMEALSRVIDPELHRPITDLGMVSSVDIAEDGVVRVEVLLTVAGCPLKDTITADTRREVGTVEGVTEVQVSLGVMNDEQKAELRRRLRGGAAEPVVPFTQPGNLTRVYAVTSGKGGVGKSSVTANLAAAMAAQGLSVGVVDADIYGFSIPRMLGVERVPTQLDGMIVPPLAHGVKVISIGMFVEDKQPVVWRGPMLHRAVQQFLSDVFWGPQTAAAEVAERTGLIATQTHQKVVGVIENMSYMPQPDGSRLEIFGSGGGEIVSTSLSETLGYEVPLLAQLPLDIRLREGSDTGLPATVAQDGKPAADAPAALELSAVAQRLTHRSRGLAGKSLGVTPA